LKRGGEAYFGLLHIYEGHELVRCKDKDAALDQRSLILWDSTRPVEFKLEAALKKVTLLVPQDRLRARIPEVDSFVGEKIDISSGLGAVMASHIATLGREAYVIEKGCGESVVDLTMELIATCLLARQYRPMTKARKDLLSDIRTYHRRQSG